MSAQDHLQPGQVLDGFLVRRVTPLPELRATAVEARHEASGAGVLHLHAPADSENALAVLFPTPPPDDTGLPHILEHAVLGGSRRFPVREPFFEMIKMSMATFINAMTGQAYTVYPVSSNVRKDFFNLATVYLDAVFHPLLEEATFRREGHHLALADHADPASPLVVSGIVYSEMKGAYSTPERVLHQLAGCGLYPDTPLGRDAGGDPARIPELAYGDFLRFHRERYHPGRALVYLYGDIPTPELLRFLAPALAGFGRPAAPPPPVPRQPRWTAPRSRAATYPLGAADDPKARTFLSLNWITGDGLDPVVEADWRVLSTLLLGSDAAPLKKAIIDAQLGADLSYCGAWAIGHEQEFHVGIKGSEPGRADAFERLVLDTLGRIAAQPFAPERIEAACQQLAYETLEVKHLYPLQLLHAVIDAWPYGADPIEALRQRERLEACRARFLADPALPGRLIRAGLLDNPHRLRVCLAPEPGAQARADAAQAAAMAARKAAMSGAEVASVAAAARDLAGAQGVPNSPEALATLPQLSVRDLPARPRRIPTEAGTVAGVTVLRNDVFANGVDYLEIDADLSGLPADLLPWLPRYGEVFGGMGVAGQDFVRVAERRTACTGGLSGWTETRMHAAEPGRALLRYRFRLKTLDQRMDEALGLLGDLLFGADPRDPARLKDVLTQARAWQRSHLVNEGYLTARRQASRGFGAAAAVDHALAGPGALRILEDLHAGFDARAEEIMDQVEAVRDAIARRAAWTVSFTGSDAAFDRLRRRLEEWAGRRDPRPAGPPPAAPAGAILPREGLAGPLKVAFCVKAMPAPHLAHPDTPLFRLGMYLARFDHFLPEIRLKGNAYGAGTDHDDGLGVLVQYSYRDPRVVETLEVFDRLRAHIAGSRWSRVDVERAVIGSAKEAEAPIRPAEATGRALARFVRGDTDALREARHAAALQATPESVRETTLRVLDAGEARATVCVVAGREALEAANARLAGRELAIADILP